MTIPADTILKLNKLPDNDKRNVINIVDAMSNRPRRKLPFIPGLISLRLNELLRSRKGDILTDEQIDDFISAVRAERRAVSN